MHQHLDAVARELTNAADVIRVGMRADDPLQLGERAADPAEMAGQAQPGIRAGQRR